MNSNRPKKALVLLGWSIFVILVVGAWQGWWPLWMIAGIAAIAALVASQGRFAPPPAPEAVQAEIDRLNRDGQGRVLRHLEYEVARCWSNERGDDGVWCGVKFFVDPVGLLMRVGVSPIIDEENMTPDSVQAYALNHYENQLGLQVIRNEITTFAGHWCVLTEAIKPKGNQVRRYSFTIHRSEYTVQFTFLTQEHFTTGEPLMAELVARCRLVTPRLFGTHALGERVRIGVPPGWVQVADEDDLAGWRVLPGPLDVRLHLLNKAGRTGIDETAFAQIPGFEKRPGCHFRKIVMPENGASGLRMDWYSPSFGKSPQWTIDAVTLPDGTAIALETEHHGKDTDQFEGFLVESFRIELLASLQPGGVQII